MSPSDSLLIQATGILCISNLSREVQRWVVEAAVVIKAFDPTTSAVISASRCFDIDGFAPCPLYACLEDGAEWVIEEGTARKLFVAKIEDHHAKVRAFSGASTLDD